MTNAGLWGACLGPKPTNCKEPGAEQEVAWKNSAGDGTNTVKLHIILVGSTTTRPATHIFLSISTGLKAT